MTNTTGGLQDVFVRKEAFEKGGHDLVDSVQDFIVELLDRVHVDLSEVSETANMSILVEVFSYHGVHDGIDGFLKMIFPFDLAMGLIRRGLVAMKAQEHLIVFDQAHDIVKEMGPDNFDAFKRGRFDIDKATQARFVDLHEQLKALEKKRPLFEFNADWLTTHPQLNVLTQSEWEAKLKDLVVLVTQMQEDAGEFSKDQTRAERIALALSKMAEMSFVKITTMEPRLQIEGKNIVGFNFVTQQGPYFFYECNGEAIMHEQGTMKPICRLALGSRFDYWTQTG